MNPGPIPNPDRLRFRWNGIPFLQDPRTDCGCPLLMGQCVCVCVSPHETGQESAVHEQALL